MQKINILKEFKYSSPTPFSHLVLEFISRDNALDKIISADGYDEENVLIELTMNGVEIPVPNFNEFMGWAFHLQAEQLNKELDYISKKENFDSAVEEKAKEMLNEKLGNVYDLLNDIENMAWKLED